MKKVLLINGLAGCGKTTLANRLIAKHGMKREILAKLLKQVTYDILSVYRPNGVNGHSLHDLVYGNDGQKSLRLGIRDDVISSEGNVALIQRVGDIWMAFLKEHTVYNSRLFTDTYHIIADCLDRYDLSSRIFQQVMGTEIIRKNISHDFHVDNLIDRIMASNDDLFVIDDYRFMNEYEVLKNHPDIHVKAMKINNLSDNKHTHASETSKVYTDIMFNLNDGEYMDEVYDSLIFNFLTEGTSNG